MPLFQLGTVLLVTGPFWGAGWFSLVGLGAMVTQGRGHALEKNPPVPFRGALDVAARIFAEQRLAFPRYVVSGGLSRAWKGEA